MLKKCSGGKVIFFLFIELTQDKPKRNIETKKGKNVFLTSMVSQQKEVSYI